jgi:hypothetical protein
MRKVLKPRQIRFGSAKKLTRGPHEVGLPESGGTFIRPMG